MVHLCAIESFRFNALNGGVNNEKMYNDLKDIGIYVWVEKFNARYKVRLRSDMDSRNVMSHIPRTLQTNSWAGAANKYITLQLPVYYVEIIYLC